MKAQCPKCGESANTYLSDGMNACRTCGERWPIGSIQQAIPPAVPAKNDEKSISEGRKKACRNCERIMAIQSDGLCGGCYGAVYRKFEKGTPEYEAALADAKARFTDPNFPRHSRKKSKKKESPGVDNGTANPEKTETNIPTKQNIPKILTSVKFAESKREIPAIDIPFGINMVIERLRAERDYFVTMIDRIDKAIQDLQP